VKEDEVSEYIAEGINVEDCAPGFGGAVVAVVVIESDPLTDELLDTINAVLAEGQWEQVEALAVLLREHALTV